MVVTQAGVGLPQKLTIQLTVNGTPVTAEINAHELLIDLLRNRLRLTGTKRSCDMQVCGACTVLLDGKPVSSCTCLAYEARSKSVLTIEGLAQGDKLHPIQEAYIEHSGFQCGFCTPGMIMATKALLDQSPDPTEVEIKEFLHGQICRCTGYEMIIESIQAAARRLREERAHARGD